MKKKGLIAVLAVCLCIMGTEVPAFAQTVNFNITVTKDKKNQDPISKRAVKADKEQNFYVTATGFSATGSIRARSRRIAGGVVSNDVVLISGAVNTKKSAAYTSTATSGDNYYMEAEYLTGPSSSNSLNVLGRYTP